MKVLVTGGAGFIGSAVVRLLVGRSDVDVVTVDCLTYAGNLSNLTCALKASRHKFIRADIRDGSEMLAIISTEKPNIIIHLAAESHVDRSIDGPADFVSTNILGTYQLLEAARSFWETLPTADQDRFRFLHVSTDEVFGSLGVQGKFVETTAYDPSSPYSASKAASDHLVRAWQRSFDLPCIITNCSNNYGPFHFPEKLIPLTIINALEGRPIPVYGSGEQIRDWLYVEDHAEALWMVATRGTPGETYNIGGNAERQNIDVVRSICACLDVLAPSGKPHAALIEHVADRPGHDLRYAMDITKIGASLGWQPRHDFETGLRKTVAWFLDNRLWWQKIRNETYGGERLGLSGNVTARDRKTAGQETDASQ